MSWPIATLKCRSDVYVHTLRGKPVCIRIEMDFDHCIRQFSAQYARAVVFARRVWLPRRTLPFRRHHVEEGEGLLRVPDELVWTP